MEDFLSIIKDLDLSQLTRKLNAEPATLFVGLAIVFLILYGLSLGRTKALISLLGIYVALAFDAAFPYLGQLHNLLGLRADIFLTRLIIFLVVYLLVFTILNNSFAKGRLTLKESSVVSVGLISLAQIGLLIAVITNIISDEIVKRMPEYLSAYFGTKEALFYWIIVPILVLVLIPKNKRER